LKKLITILFAISIVSACHSQTANSFALWASGGYSNFLSGVEDISHRGGIGGNIGLGYDLRAGGFLLQLGGEYQHYTSTAAMKEFTEIIPMLNSEGKYYDGIFIFDKNRDKQTMGNAAAVLKFGFITGSNFYMLFGGKYAYNLYGSTRTTTTVTQKGYYDNLIGEDDNGIFSEMPNHNYFTKKRKVNEKLSFAPTIFGSIEAGMQMENWSFLGATYRLAFFFDFGVTSLNSKPLLNASRIIDISKTEEFQPAVRPFFYNEKTAKINVLFTGIKLTVLFGNEHISNKNCHCIQNIKWKHIFK
jgi:hypothetical protein